jgi:hypothetical protein
VKGTTEDFEIDDLAGVYKEMDKEGKKKMVMVAGKLLNAQKIFENEEEMIEDKSDSEKFENE